MSKNKTVKVTIEIPSQLYGAISLYFNEPHESMNDTLIELIKAGINATSEKQWQSTRREENQELSKNDTDSQPRNT